jgi:signal transduction histidine kinase
MIKTLATAKGLKVESFISLDVPSFIKADKKRIKQVLINLLNNALKFTLKGKITVEVEVSQDSNSQFQLPVLSSL